MKTLIVSALLISSLFGCSKDKNQAVEKIVEEKKEEKKPHKFGGWYCPDNLNVFPPVNIKDWKNVPVISDRLPTKEETRTESSLMYINSEEYPNAKVLDVDLPKIATYYSEYTKKTDYIIIIQAVEVNGDSIVGFRYLNGGNGSARFKEVKFMNESEINSIPTSQFVSVDLKINNTQDEIWKNINQRTSEVFTYGKVAETTSKYADKLFGCWYIQNDYVINKEPYVEKILLLEKEGFTEMKIVFGPFNDDFEFRKNSIVNWAENIKTMSEK